ncbi:hypothetical protein D7B24_004522 [Verticillium nonalfalfae]|uniref:DUF221-domain-containing protein n=1 Tax=Verticillium nonalfalfae TaxID=1051616 RepID=A0A3M9XW86_9PEZI|nr:uncharacterized protein D7B24_004522 [Verticillium nonalfalfae]RNJ52062.1 hypothetical protein D7B24_004522 [Verticillium nonalfalfae]
MADEPSQGAPGSAESRAGTGLNAFLAALAASVIIFAVQISIFLLLRNRLARIFKPKTYLAPERERTDPPPRNPVQLIKTLWTFSDRDIIRRCGLDAYFFLRFLKTLLIIFVPMMCILIPILVPINYIGGEGQDVIGGRPKGQNSTSSNNRQTGPPRGLDTLTMSNISRENSSRYWAHLIMAILVISWVCVVFYFELRVYIKIRQDHLTSAEHRLRASATTVLVNNVPPKWLTEEGIRGLFDVFPGGIRNVWLNRDLGQLLEKIELRTQIHRQLESAETDLIKMAKKNQLKQRKKDEKKARKASHGKAPTKADMELRRKQEDAAAHQMAEAGQGVSSGAHEEVPHDVSEAVDQHQQSGNRRNSHVHIDDGDRPEHETENGSFGFGLLSGGLEKVGQGLRGGVGKAGMGFKTLGHDVEDGVNTTNGFMRINSPGAGEHATYTRGSADHARIQAVRGENVRPGTTDSAECHSRTTDAAERVHSTHSRDASDTSQIVKAFSNYDTTANGNTIRKVSNLNNLYDNEKRQWYQFWRAPPGGFASPVPQMQEGSEFPFGQKKTPKTFAERVKSWIPGMGDDELPAIEYDPASYSGKDYQATDGLGEPDAAWRKYVKPSKRPRHRLPRWGFPTWLAWLTFGKKVDTIYWCRTELARLNLEIREDQAHPERYPLMNSAFIQFNEQISAHMACQSLIHHLPKQMAPRVNEVSPNDVIWSNMAIKWWDEWFRTGAVTLLITAMVIFWAVPVAWTAALANIDKLTSISWLRWIENNNTVYQIAGGIAGILPPLILALVLILVPILLDLLADFKGAKTGAQKTEFVQQFYFMFLFVQVFLVVSVASFFAGAADELFANLQKFNEVDYIWTVLADNLPQAANYFFSYMILQALSSSSGALLQIGALLVWYVLAKMLDTTARNKWTRNTTLSGIKWGHLFPVYTNFACIGLIYSVTAPLINIFACITFGLLLLAQKYCLLYVVRAGIDTGGVLYPRAINQLFTGLYVMELSMAGMFFVARDENNRPQQPQAIIMLVTVGLTICYQVLLNRSFSPLFRYLPVTGEDEAAIRDEVFHQEQLRRFGMVEETDQDTDGADAEKRLDGSIGDSRGREDDEIELQGLSRNDTKKRGYNPVKGVRNLAVKGGQGLRNVATWKKVEAPSAVRNAAYYRRHQRQKDLEAQRAIGEALYGGVADEIEDLMPEERNALVQESFKHTALRARMPTVWIPRDDLGVSDDEIRLTREYTENIHISNEGTALDSKVRVVYGRNPPDFSEVDLIDL